MHLPKGMLQHLRLWRHDPNKEKDTSGLFPLESSCLAVMFDKFRIHTVDGVQKSGEHHLGCIKLCRMKLSIKRPTGICRNSELYNVNNNIHFIDALFFYVLSLKKCSFQGILIPLDPHLKNPSKKQMWALRTSLSRQWYGKKQHSYSASRSKESGKIHRRCHNETPVTYPPGKRSHIPPMRKIIAPNRNH